ncbi:S8 family serine peptidase [Cellulomonas chengniuliangii]|uniref:S8 family serine peptidase n=1 Tax=Cellulomonas chengniuliangii TaxID=2968084 RepID=UPI001D0EF25A|nr:S8 family serine peptidase [Cellulomonas chengniuliangii]MCC2318878.1 S8 family serine peptidase [Cellulomonas chengniuliangii]
MTPGARRSTHLVVGLVAIVAAGGVVSQGSAAVAAEVACAPGTTMYVPDAPPALARLASEAAWRTATGAGVVVAVVDSGVDAGNAHLADAVLPGVDLVGADGDPAGLTDTDGHGTAVAGQIAARAVPGSGVVGLAPEAMVLPVRVFVADDEQAVRDGVGPRADRVAAGIRYAAEHGARVVNVSMSTTEDSPELRSAVQDATRAGALVVASVGNRAASGAAAGAAAGAADGLRYPAAYPEVLAVTAVDDADQVAEGSVRGAHVGVAAPGANVLTTYHAAGDCMLAGDLASTSFATAYVSAAAALLVERYPEETPAQWRHRLEVTAARVHPGERDDQMGWGLIRPDQALAFVDDGSAAGPVSPVHGRPPAASDAVEHVMVEVRADPLATTRSVGAWWTLGGLTAVLLAVLAARLGGTRRRQAKASSS